MAEGPDYIRVTVPAPGERYLAQYIRSEIVHELIGIWGNPGIGERYVKSEIVHSMPAKTPISTLGVWPSDNILPDSITMGLSHVLT